MPVQYSFSLTTFSPSGKLVQIEYALNAVAAGSTSLGIKVDNHAFDCGCIVGCDFLQKEHEQCYGEAALHVNPAWGNLRGHVKLLTYLIITTGTLFA